MSHDPGDENDYDLVPEWKRWRFVVGDCVSCVVGGMQRIVESHVDHDPGDEQHVHVPAPGPLWWAMARLVP